MVDVIYVQSTSSGWPRTGSLARRGVQEAGVVMVVMVVLVGTDVLVGGLQQRDSSWI